MAIEPLTGKEDEFFDFVEMPKESRSHPRPNYNAKLTITFGASSDAFFI